MIAALMEKTVVLKQSAAIVDNAALTVNVLDTQGYDFVAIDVYLGATDAALTVLKVQESDVKASATALTGGVDLVGTRFATDNQDTGVVSVLPTATDDNKVYQFIIDCKARKRYLLPLVTIGVGAVVGGFVVIVAKLSRAKEGPRLASQAGVAQRMIV